MGCRESDGMGLTFTLDHDERKTGGTTSQPMTGRSKTPWPDWFEWELELSPHLLDRMVDRDFSEADLRTMLADAMGYRPSATFGRFVVETTWESDNWEVVVEPDDGAELLVVVTAYRVT
jgi:hypothetical protein